MALPERISSAVPLLTSLDTFVGRSLAAIGLPCLLLSVLVAQFLPGFTWRDIAIGALAGTVIGVPLICRMAAMEIRAVSTATVAATIQAYEFCLGQADLDIDKPIMVEAIRNLAMEKLKGRHFYSLNLEYELRVPEFECPEHVAK